MARKLRRRTRKNEAPHSLGEAAREVVWLGAKEVVIGFCVLAGIFLYFSFSNAMHSQPQPYVPPPA
jgi:hypothetical protein